MGKIMDNRSSLYNIALQCAKLNDDGCAKDCACCQFNIFNYGLAINEASLLKANAYTDYYNTKEVMREVNRNIEARELAPLVMVILVVILCLWSCSTIERCMNKPPTQAMPTEDTELMYLRDNPNNVNNIALVFKMMAKWGVGDINDDGKKDCIDYSCWFRMLYGSDARLIINKNPKAGMNHMFVRIYSENGVLDVEPQGSAVRYSMGLIWGSKYDPMFNRDVTSAYSMVTGGM